MMRLNVRNKLLLFSVVIAILPLLVAGQSLIRIAQDEMKSSANDQLVTAARQITTEIDDVYRRAWLAPLLLIRNAIDEEGLGVQEKISLLKSGIAGLEEIVALQITLERAPLPLMVSQDDFVARLQESIEDPLAILRVPKDFVLEHADSGFERVHDVQYIAETDDWLATVIMPLETQLASSDALLSARINLGNLRGYIENHPFRQTGELTIVDGNGLQVFDPERSDLSGLDIVRQAVAVLDSTSRLISVEPYARPDGEIMLGSFSFPSPFNWAVLVEKSERDAYLALELMIRSLIVWVSIGVGIAIAGAVIFAMRISRPILAIGNAAIEVAQGNFQTRVTNVRSRDEIGDLAARINEMIVQLNERFQLQKFVSGDTMAAIQRSDEEGVKLGGARERVAILFADIRGYTEFSEDRDPETVVEVLNHYFQRQADIVSEYGGDIDKFVGDQIMAVFHGEAMSQNAVACSLAIQGVMVELGREYAKAELEIGIGVDVGDVVVGAMGSSQRMDYTVLGDHVNVAARLCSNAAPKETLITESVYKEVRGSQAFALKALEPIQVKGKAKALKVYAVEAKAEPAPKQRRRTATPKKPAARKARAKPA
jgi:adenylate cyclase